MTPDELKARGLWKAYICTEDEEGRGGVVFAHTNIAARKIAADEWNGGELAGLTVFRAPDLDQYAGKGVPAALLICNHGWHWDGCCYCGQRLEYDALCDAGKDPKSVVGLDGGQVFCDQVCSNAADARRAQEQQAGDAVISAMESRLVARFGAVSITRTYHFTRCQDGGCTTEQARVSFNFPGANHGGASLHYEDPVFSGSTKTLPHQLFLTCAKGDMAAFEEFAAAADAHHAEQIAAMIEVNE